jgi:hypothetical protein
VAGVRLRSPFNEHVGNRLGNESHDRSKPSTGLRTGKTGTRMARRQRKDLHAALLGAFPNENDFERLLSLEMDARLDNISTPAPWPNRLLEVMQWVEDQGRLDELVRVAQEAQPNSPALRAYLAQWPSTPTRLGSPTAFALPSDAAQLERLMRLAIPWFALLAISAVALTSNPSETMVAIVLTGLLMLAVASFTLSRR